jgi:integrase/recombinase XerD
MRSTNMNLKTYKLDSVTRVCNRKSSSIFLSPHAINKNGNDFNVSKVIQSFIFDRKSQQLSDGTIAFYQKKLKKFQVFCQDNELSEIIEITPNTIRDFINYLSDTNHNPGGVHTFYRAIKTLLNWFENEYELNDWKNPIKRVKSPKVPNEILEPVRSEDIKALLNSCNLQTIYGLRDYSMILTLADTGVRANELLSIVIEDLDFEENKILIRHGKGNKYRFVYLSENTIQSINRYIEKRVDQNPSLWIGIYNRKLNYSGLRGVIRRRAKAANINTPSIHSFRRFFALEMLCKGVDIFSLQKLMGHSDIQILRRYLKQVDQDIKIAHQFGSPVNNLLSLTDSNE